MHPSGDAEQGVPRTHIVSARLDGGLVIGQTVVPDKSNAWTAIRPRLTDLELAGRVVSIDALGHPLVTAPVRPGHSTRRTPRGTHSTRCHRRHRISGRLSPRPSRGPA